MRVPDVLGITAMVGDDELHAARSTARNVRDTK
jgi:hypothetical protein